MFGENEVERKDNGDGKTLRVVAGSPFYTIQGEGPFSGRPAVFLRLHGCNLRCFFCDTQFSDPEDPTMTIEEIHEQATELGGNLCKLLVITGGEPLRQTLGPVIKLFLKYGWKVQIETAGVYWQSIISLTGVTVVCSPKTPVIHPAILAGAHAFKYIIKAGDVDPNDGLPTASTQVQGKTIPPARPRDGAPVYLSPMDEQDPTLNYDNAVAVGQLAMKYGHTAGVQLHKVLRLP